MPKALRAAGAWADERLRLRTVPGKGTGLFVDAPVQPGDVLAVVPARALLSGSLAKHILGRDAAEVEPRVALCALLAEARREAEKGNDTLGLMEYLLALPVSFPGLPFCMNDEEAASHLAGTALLPALLTLRQGTESDRQVAEAQLGGELEALWDAKRWRWAQATILTRAGDSLRLPGAQGGGPAAGDEEAEGRKSVDPVIVPLVDFANCDGNPSAECQQGDGGEVRLMAKTALAKGAEVTISYGPQSQEQLLFTFGFSLPGAPIVVTTPVPLALPETPVAEDQVPPVIRNKLLRLLDLDRDAAGLARLSRLSNGTLDKTELWAAVNLREMDKAALKEVMSAVVNSGGNELPASLGERLAGPGPRAALRELLDEWAAELEQGRQSPPRRRSADAGPALAYRQSCREIVDEARKQLDEEEAAMGPTFGAQITAA